MKSVTDAVRFQLPQCRPDPLRADCFSGVYGQPQAVISGMFVNFAELLGPGTALVSTDTNAGDTAVAEANGLVDHASGFVDSEMTDGVEDPIQRHAKVTLAALAPAFGAFEERSKFLSSPLHHPDRDIHLRVHHTLRVQLLHHAIGNEFIVVG